MEKKTFGSTLYIWGYAPLFEKCWQRARWLPRACVIKHRERERERAEPQSRGELLQVIAE